MTDMISFANETEMIDAYTAAQVKDELLSVMAVVFEQYNEPTIKYKLRHSFTIPNNLYQNVIEEGKELLSLSTRTYFKANPFTQVQICVDEALIKHAAPDSANIKVL